MGERPEWAMLLQHRADAIAVLRRTGLDASDAEDCVHDAMIRLVRRANLDPTRVHSLLIRASLHVAIDRHRRRQRGERLTGRLAASALADVSTPEQEAQTKADAARVFDTITLLPPRERQVMLLRLAGMSVGEVAQYLGVSYKAVEGTFTRARARLRAMLGNTMAAAASVARRLSLAGGGEVVAGGAAALLFLLPRVLPAEPPGERPPAVPLPAAALAVAGPGPTSTPPTVRPDQLSITDVLRPGDRRATGAGGGGHQPPPDGQRIQEVPPVTVTNPADPNGPPLLYFGGAYGVLGPMPSDPVGRAEYCLLGGGFVIDEPDPVHQSGYIGCPDQPGQKN